MSLLYFIVGQVTVRLGKLSQLRLIVHVRLRDFEAGCTLGDVGLDVDDAVNFLQIASDRGGAAGSCHIGDFKGHERKVRCDRLRRSRFRRLGVQFRSRLTAET